MKKTVSVLLTLIIAASLVCCTREEYVPVIILPEGYAVEGNVISANLVNEYYFDPYEKIRTEGGCVALYADPDHEVYFEGGEIELSDGVNTYYLVFFDSERTVDYTLELFCVMIMDFTVTVNEEKVYSVGDDFDRSTVTVTARKDDGGLIEVSDYSAAYSFDKAGKSKVTIGYGGIVHWFYVDVV